MTAPDAGNQGERRGVGAATQAMALDPPAARRLAALGKLHSLDQHQTRQLGRLLAIVAGDDLSPTAVRDPLRAVDRHLADSLTALEIEAVREARTACDLGAGAGFPGLPLAIALPACRLALIESVHRKCQFLARATDAAEAHNASVVCARVEEWAAGAGRQDAAVARALAPAPVVVEYAAPLLRRGGVLVDWRGRRDASEERHAAAAAAEVGLRLEEIRNVAPFPGADHHHLHLYLKVRNTPPRFPRRAGMARKRPLPASRLG